MPKYYVESGNLKDIVNSNDALSACAICVSRAAGNIKKNSVELGEVFITSEKGFPSERMPFKIDTHHEIIINTEDVFEAL